MGRVCGGIRGKVCGGVRGRVCCQRMSMCFS